MAIKCTNLAKVRQFQSKFDPEKGTEGATTFRLKGLDARVMAKLRDDALVYRVSGDAKDLDAEAEARMAGNQLSFNVCQFGIDGWDNLLDEETGDEIPYKTKTRHLGGKSYEVVDPDVLGRIHPKIIAELAREIRGGNELDDEDLGN